MLGFGYCLMLSWLFCFLCFMPSVSLTGFYTEVEPEIDAEENKMEEEFDTLGSKDDNA